MQTLDDRWEMGQAVKSGVDVPADVGAYCLVDGRRGEG